MSNIRLIHWGLWTLHHSGWSLGPWLTACVAVWLGTCNILKILWWFFCQNLDFTSLKLFLVISTPAPLSSGRPESARPSFATAIKDKVGKRKKKQQRLNHDLNDTTLSTAGGGDNDFLENSKYFKKESVRISFFPTQNVSNSCFQTRNNSLKNAIEASWFILWS